MTAEPEETPADPAPAPKASGKLDNQPARPKPPTIEQRREPQAEVMGALLRPLAAGLIAGLVGGGIVSVLLTGAPKPDEQTKLLIKDLQDKIKDEQTKTAQLSESLRAKLAEAPVKAASPEDLSQLRARLEDLSKLKKEDEEAIQSLSQKIQALEQKPAPEPEKEAVQAAIASQIAPVTERLAGLERSQNEKVSDARTAAITIAVKNLERAMNEGKPFAVELAAIESLSTEKLPVSALAPYKDSGVPTLAQLQREFDDTIRNVIVNHYHVKAQSLMDEILSRARGAIQVKPTGGEGNTLEAILGRMEKALKAGDLQGALTAFAALDGPDKKDMQVWLEHAQARAAAEEAVRKTDQALLASLTKPSATN